MTNQPGWYRRSDQNDLDSDESVFYNPSGLHGNRIGKHYNLTNQIGLLHPVAWIE